MPKKLSGQDQFCPWRTPTKLSSHWVTFASVMPCFLCSLLYPLAIKHTIILSPLILTYLTLGESQLVGCFLGLPAVGIFLATVIFPFEWPKRKEGAHRAWCNLLAILPLSGHRSSANSCYGLLRAQIFGGANTTFFSFSLFDSCQCAHGSWNVLGFFPWLMLYCPSCCFFWQTVSVHAFSRPILRFLLQML